MQSDFNYRTMKIETLHSVMVQVHTHKKKTACMVLVSTCNGSERAISLNVL